MENTETTLWQIRFSRKAEKQKNKLTKKPADILYLLQKDLEIRGPVVYGWHNYGKLLKKKFDYYHCHLNKGHPTYVVVWQVIDETVRILEIQFVGTHEDVDYSYFK